jgi:hypothetical protein
LLGLYVGRLNETAVCPAFVDAVYGNRRKLWAFLAGVGNQSRRGRL